MAVETDTRDFLAEAQEIARTGGDCRILASHQHVTALLDLFEATKIDLAHVGAIVASIILDQLQPGHEPVMWIPASMTDRIAAAKCGVVLERKHGAKQELVGTLVTLVLPTPAAKQM